jgi:type II secretory pathway component PulJ
MTRRAPHRGGFTLFEVVGVILVTSFVVGAATNYYIDLSRASNRAASNTRDIRRATAILDRVARDFESTLLVVKPPETDPLAHPWLFVAEAQDGESGADHIKFITRNFQPRRSEEHESDLTVVAYTVRAGEEDDTLEVFRWTDPRLPDGLDRTFPSEDDEAAVLLAEGLADFGVRFTGEDGEEKDTWDSTMLVESSSLPASVEITVGMADPNASGEDPDDVVRRCSSATAPGPRAKATKRRTRRTGADRTARRTRIRAGSRSATASTFPRWPTHWGRRCPPSWASPRRACPSRGWISKA